MQSYRNKIGKWIFKQEFLGSYGRCFFCGRNSRRRREGFNIVEPALMAECAELVKRLGSIGSRVLKARQEEDFLAYMAATLRTQVGCDAVIIRLLERYIQTRAVATASKVEVLSPMELMAPFAEEDQELLLSVGDGVFCADVRTSPYIKPDFRPHVLGLGLTSGFMAPLVRGTELCGQIVFGWSSRPQLDQAAREQLRSLADYGCLMTTMFQLKKAQEMDGATGLLNRFGLRRRWQVASGAPQGAVLLAEVGGFHLLRETRGRLAADDFLRRLARALRAACDSRCVIGRFSDDALVLIVTGVGRNEVDGVKADMETAFRSVVAELPRPYPHLVVGTALWPDDGFDLELLMQQAEHKGQEQKREQVRLALGYGSWGKGAESLVSSGFFESWLARSPDGIIVTDANLRVLYVNPAYERLTGHSLDEWVDSVPRMIASGKTPPEVYDAMWRDIEKEGVWVGQVINRRPSGEEWVSHLRITKIEDREGRLLGYIGLAQEA